VQHLLKYHPALRDQPWERYRVKDGEKGPMVWEAKHTLFYPKDAQGLPGKPYHLVIARNVLKPDEIKFFISNAPPETKVETLLLVGFSRWRVERCFQDQKSELGESVATILGIGSDMLRVLLYFSRTHLAKEGGYVGTGRIRGGSHRRNHAC
jgi:hypothetical protein